MRNQISERIKREKEKIQRIKEVKAKNNQDADQKIVLIRTLIKKLEIQLINL